MGIELIFMYIVNIKVHDKIGLCKLNRGIGVYSIFLRLVEVVDVRW